MRLKSLEITGFKSFIDRTVINFEEGITGVVGPNGCGKSNIVDAIRWVMGEQSAKHLRGGAMEDVIFAGSETRPPIGMAQVLLTLDNVDGMGPQDYADVTEIEIGRRLYRSGESEYLINKTPCRLKDIVDIFLDTGVGTKAYSIVEQGMVDQLIGAKPYDRRLFIEEAAGISKFKSRKEAALRKIESTQSNVLRLTDILSELARQLNSLNRQAKKAERYQKLSQELKEKEVALAAVRFGEMKQSLEDFKTTSQARMEDEAALSAELSRHETDLESKKIAAAELERELEDSQRELYAASQSVKLSEAAIEHKTKEIENMIGRGEAVLKEIKGLKERLSAVAQKLKDANDENVQSDFSLASLAGEAGELEAQVVEKRGHCSKMKDEAEEYKRRILSDTAAQSELKAKLSHLEEHIRDLSERVEKDRLEISSTDEQRSGLGQKISEADGGVGGLVRLKDKLFEDLGSKRNDLVKTKEELFAAEQEFRKNSEAHSNAKSRLSSLEEMRKNLDGYREGVKSIMRRSKEAAENFKGILGIVGEIIETEPKYEAALSAVLGDRLQFVVVDSHDKGVEAIEYLKSAAGGRGSFIPLAVRTGEAKHSSMPRGNGIIGPLAEHVRFNKDYSPVVNYLLNDVVLVEDVRSAVRHWNTLDYQTTFATLDGEVLDHSGVITGGIGGEANELIARARRIKELEGEIALRQRQADQSAAQVREKSEAVKQLESEIETQNRDAHNFEIKLVGEAGELEGQKEEHERLGKQHEKLVVEIAAMEEEKREADEDYASTGLRFRQINENYQNIKQSLDKTSASLTSLTKDLEEGEGKLLEMKVSLAQAEEKQASGAREMEALIASKSQLIFDIGKKEDDCTLNSQRVVHLRRETEELKESIVSSMSTVENLTALQQGSKDKYQTLTNQMREIEMAMRESRKRREQALSTSHEATLKLTELREKIRYLEEGIRERHRVEISTVSPDSMKRDLDLVHEEQQVQNLKERLEQIGQVNTDAINEYAEIFERHKFINTQHADLTASIDTLKQAISRINRISRQRFKAAFESVNEKFQDLFPKLFEGGLARLMLTDEDNLLETGVEIVVQPPGKKLQSISLLSGGEKALTAVALIFSIFLTKPSPFCLLDEVDAPLDDANVDRFNKMIRSMTNHSQFVLITHNKRTMELSDILYGVTMQEAGVSRMVSVRLSGGIMEPQAAVA